MPAAQTQRLMCGDRKRPARMWPAFVLALRDWRTVLFCKLQVFRLLINLFLNQ